MFLECVFRRYLTGIALCRYVLTVLDAEMMPVATPGVNMLYKLQAGMLTFSF